MAIPGLSTPESIPRPKVAASKTTAPVFPALKKASAFASLTNSMPFTMEELRFFLCLRPRAPHTNYFRGVNYLYGINASAALFKFLADILLFADKGYLAGEFFGRRQRPFNHNFWGIIPPIASTIIFINPFSSFL